jgi:hypothetical protein
LQPQLDAPIAARHQGETGTHQHKGGDEVKPGPAGGGPGEDRKIPDIPC